MQLPGSWQALLKVYHESLCLIAYAILHCCVSLQGYSRRILVRARPIATSGSLPLTVDSITGVSVGGLCIRSHTHKGLDSYQEDGLTLLRSRWNEALEKRKQYLDDKMQLLAAKQGNISSVVLCHVISGIEDTLPRTVSSYACTCSMSYPQYFKKFSL